MQVAFAALILVAVAGVTAQPRASVADTARSVAERVDRREMGRDARLDMLMRLIDRQGRVRERSLLLTALRDPAEPGDRLLVRFLGPNDIKGTAFLVWEHPDTEDERFLYLPALGRVRRIAGAEKQESFAGSDFSYEDIGRRRLDDYTYAFVDQNGSWTGPDGRAYPAWQIEARAVEAQARYPTHRVDDSQRQSGGRGRGHLQPPQRTRKAVRGAAATGD